MLPKPRERHIVHAAVVAFRLGGTALAATAPRVRIVRACDEAQLFDAARQHPAARVLLGETESPNWEALRLVERLRAAAISRQFVVCSATVTPQFAVAAVR